MAGAEILLYLGVSLSIGAFTTWFCTRVELPIPYTCFLFLEGAAIASLHYYADVDLKDFEDSVSEWLALEGEVLLFIFLPPLLYGEAMGLNWFHTKEVLMQCLVLASVGVLTEAFIVGPLMYMVLPHGWNFKLCMLVAGITAATDPVAVVALLKDMNASTQLTMLIVGESLMNDGTGMALFELFKGMLEGEEYASTSSQIALYAFKIVFLSPLVGLLVGLISVFCLRKTNRQQQNEKLTQVIITILASYFSFYFAQHTCGLSGVLSTCAAGLCVAKWGSPLVLDHHMMHTIWEFFEWTFNTVLFMLAGLFFVDRAAHYAYPQDYGYVVLVYLFLLLSRSVALLLLFPLLNKAGERQVSWEDAVFMAWSGLRGALGIALGLVVLADHHHMGISEEHANQVFLIIGGTTTLTLIVNATTAKYILQRLGLIGVEDTDKLMTIHQLRMQMDGKLLKQLARMKEDLGISRRNVLKHLTLLKTDLKELKERKAQQMMLQESESNHWLSILRCVYLDVVRVEYWHDIDSGKLPRLDQSGPYMLYTVDKAEALTDTHEVGEVDLDKIIGHTEPSRDPAMKFVTFLRWYFPKSPFLIELERAMITRTERLRVHLLSSYMSAHEKAEKKMIEMGLISRIGMDEDLPDSPTHPDTPGTPSNNIFEMEHRKEKDLKESKELMKAKEARKLSEKNLRMLAEQQKDETEEVEEQRKRDAELTKLRSDLQSNAVTVDGVTVFRSPDVRRPAPLDLESSGALPPDNERTPARDHAVTDNSDPHLFRHRRRSCGNGHRVLTESRRAVARARDVLESMDPYMVREVLSLQVAQSVLHMGMTVVVGMVKGGLLSEKDSEDFFLSFDRDRREIDAMENRLYMYDPNHGVSHDDNDDKSDADFSLYMRTPVDGRTPVTGRTPVNRSRANSDEECL